MFYVTPGVVLITQTPATLFYASVPVPRSYRLVPRSRIPPPTFDARSNLLAVAAVPPVALEDAAAERWPSPAVARMATVEWRARRLASRRQLRPLRSRPGGLASLLEAARRGRRR
ncbi:MAG TPA: hypothetical protein VKR78_07590 [Acidimicrobiales bacterium]|nr:hypothetical protein [Acidimicrobiales bacterium]